MGLISVLDPTFWAGTRVLVTGHTGFKGTWLSLWLTSLGASVSGLALEPSTSPSLFEAVNARELVDSAIADIRELDTVMRAFQRVQPEVVFHMAAQPLVRRSYEDPVATYATNVMGTVHVMEAVRSCESVRAVVNVTTDKCYENREWEWGYREDDPMGGHDPYSNSKACSELVTSAYRRSFIEVRGTAVASARAGNVIGGGDWSDDRLIPDVLRAFARAEPVLVRNPDSVRPWQHVLEPLSGYLLLAQALCSRGDEVSGGWNFGPNDADARPVRWIVEKLAERWSGEAGWTHDSSDQPHEAVSLKLDISKARHRLGWSPTWSLEEALARVIEWHNAWLAGQDVRAVCLQQISEFSGASTKEAT